LAALRACPGNTVLRPNTDTGLAARVHNASSTPADNTVVRFWEFFGGVESHSCSAWRNTETRIVVLGTLWELNLALKKEGPTAFTLS
jgi:hypothetical protein